MVGWMLVGGLGFRCMPEATQVRSMFARIARRYDLLNHVLSMGIDRGWRRAVLRQAGKLEDKVAVDVAAGTGDLTFVLEKAGAKTLGVDFTHEMLVLAENKRGTRPCLFVDGDALRLPLRDDVADVATIAFGLRNLEDRVRGLAELGRIVRPGGQVLVLEFSMPKGRILGAGYSFYFRRVLPLIGGWISGDAGAYRYLPETVQEWPEPEVLQTEMEGVGLVDCGFRRLSGGIACLSYGTVPGGR